MGLDHPYPSLGLLLRLPPRALLLLCLVIAVATLSCATATNSPTASALTSTPSLSRIVTDPGPGRTALRCEECPQVAVTGVVDAETVQTADGAVRIYGVFVAPEEEQCVAEAEDLLNGLVGSVVRTEEGPVPTDSRGTPIRYLYTAAGDSIDELLVSGGTARVSAFEGKHAPWLLFQANEARVERRGCIWERYEELFPGRAPRQPG
jgi:endonuclease YncB( thermonuclease family)